MEMEAIENAVGATREENIKILEKLNAGYLAADQSSNVAWYEVILDDDYIAQLPDLKVRDKAAFLDMLTKGRPFTGLACNDVKVRLLGDVALIQAGVTFKTLDGVDHIGRYTDIYQARDGKWRCIAADVITDETTFG